MTRKQRTLYNYEGAAWHRVEMNFESSLVIENTAENFQA